ncbi:MAG: GIY-YIG nuclease family protein [Cyanobacteria bacterium P01_F01_bin.143]
MTLASLEYFTYLDNTGCIPEDLRKKIGIYAIFNQEKELQFVGYSRDVYLSLQQHLVRQPTNCYWFKLQTITRPSRTVLEETCEAWIAENGKVPDGNGDRKSDWTQAIDVKPMMNEEEKAQYATAGELKQGKTLKKVARRIENTIKQQLSDRGVTMNFRFNPKLKEKGLLDLKS